MDGKRISLLVLLTALAVSIFCAAYPMYVIRPFRLQGTRELAAALVVLQYRNLVTALCVVAACAALVLYWRAQPLRLRKSLALVAAVLVGVFAGLSRVNVYEQMFHPLGAPEFASASAIKLDGGEMVLAVQQSGEARAYPVRAIAYHHIVNDTVGGVPIVATY